MTSTSDRERRPVDLRTFASREDALAAPVASEHALELICVRDLHALVGGCAEWLRSLGVERGERVGVSIADALTHFVVALGLGTLGAAHATLATHDPESARARLAARVGVRRVVAARSAFNDPARQ